MNVKYALVLASVGVITAAAAVVRTAQADKVPIQVYKTSTCGCCSKWVDHLKDNGFDCERSALRHFLLEGVDDFFQGCQACFALRGVGVQVHQRIAILGAIEQA